MIADFLKRFNSIGSYVSWKNNHEIDLVLAGKSDLDIYVPEEKKGEFLKLVKHEKWAQAVNPVADYPHVYHFFNVDEHLNVFHLHVYFKIITGESWLKEYNLPLGEFLLKNRMLHYSGIYILKPEAQAYIFVLRHFLKGYSFPSRILYKKEQTSYKEEWSYCKSDFNPELYLDFLDLSPFMSGSGLRNEFQLPKRAFARKVRTKMQCHLRFKKSSLTGRRIRSFKKRLFNKVFYKQRTVLPKGCILSFSGADGVGKSTMAETIGMTYNKILTVKTVHLGKPQGFIVEFARKILNKKQNQSRRGGDFSLSKKISLKKAISVTYLACLRLKEAWKAGKYKEKGYLVISDRWPTLEHDKMDGPQLNQQRVKGGFYKFLAKKEQQYYNRIPEADLTFILTIPIEEAVRRNRHRTKAGKETDIEIRKIHEINKKHKPKSQEIVIFDNDGELKPKRFELIQIIQKHLMNI